MVALKEGRVKPNSAVAWIDFLIRYVRRTTATTRTKPKTKKKIQILNLNLRFRMRYLLSTLYTIVYLYTNNVNFFDFMIKYNYKSYNIIY